jgi:hypothetical protein
MEVLHPTFLPWLATRVGQQHGLKDGGQSIGHELCFVSPPQSISALVPTSATNIGQAEYNRRTSTHPRQGHHPSVSPAQFRRSTGTLSLSARVRALLANGSSSISFNLFWPAFGNPTPSRFCTYFVIRTLRLPVMIELVSEYLWLGRC